MVDSFTLGNMRIMMQLETVDWDAIYMHFLLLLLLLMVATGCLDVRSFEMGLFGIYRLF